MKNPLPEDMDKFHAKKEKENDPVTQAFAHVCANAIDGGRWTDLEITETQYGKRYEFLLKGSLIPVSVYTNGHKSITAITVNDVQMPLDQFLRMRTWETNPRMDIDRVFHRITETIEEHEPPQAECPFNDKIPF